MPSVLTLTAFLLWKEGGGGLIRQGLIRERGLIRAFTVWTSWTFFALRLKV